MSWVLSACPGAGELVAFLAQKIASSKLRSKHRLIHAMYKNGFIGGILGDTRQLFSGFI